MKHRTQTDALCSTAKNPFMKSTSSFNDLEISSNFSVATKRCSLDSYGAYLSTTPAATHQEAPLHHQLPLIPFPCWKLYENSFYVDGKLIPKYNSRYLNPPLHRAANSFTSASKDNALVLAAAQHYDAAVSLNFSSYSVDSHQLNTALPPSSLTFPMAPARNLNPAASAFWEHHELHRLGRAQEAAMPSDLLNAQALSQPLGLPPSDSLKCPSLHLDCKIPNAAGEERRTKQSRTNMAACSIQATLASILQRLRIVEENQSRSNAAISKVRLEMEDASSRIQELEFSHESALREINILLQRFGEQMTTSRRKEQEKLRSAFLRLREEIEEERNTCRLLKLENKKLMKELEEANSVAADTGEELDRERQARELMEEVCNELAREIGEDKAEVEQLKQEQAKSREIVEEELKMMRMASLWRDERVSTKISGAQLELDDNQMGMPLQELKSKIEEFVSTVSEVGSEAFKDPMHAEYIEEKQQKIIEQAKMLRHALELSMQEQLADGGGLVQVQADFNLKEEKILTPITQDQHIYSSSNCCSNASSLTSRASKIHDCREQSMSHIDHVELRLKPSTYMLNYSKKPCKDIRRPRTTSGDDHEYHAANTHHQARKHLLLDDHDVETQLETSSGKIILENDHVQALHQSPSPEQLMYESSKIWLASEKHRKDHGLTHAGSSGDRNELQVDESRLLKRSLSSTRTPSKGLHRKQLSLHFDARREAFGENAEVWKAHVSPNIQVKSYSEDDASHICADEASTNARQMMNRRRPTNCICTSQREIDMHPWKSPGQEDERDDDDIGHHAECLMRHEYEHAKSLCAGGAEGEEPGEFDGFYFEPVMDADAIEGHSIHYVQGDDVDDHLEMADDEDRAISSVYKSTQQSKSPNEFTKSLVHDGNGQKNARYSGTSTKGSYREEAPHKLVVPTPTIRVPLAKAQFTSPKSARSVSPSKPQVLQCFRPPPTSPEHHIAASAAPLFIKSNGKAGTEGPHLVMEAQSSTSSCNHTSKAPTLLKTTSFNKSAYTMIGQEGAHQRSSKMQGDGEASTSKMLEEKKDNSLRAELLKAREMDLQQYVEHVHYNMQKQAAAAAAPPPPPPGKSSASSSFRFSPLRKSLTSNSHGSR